ncbi:hypothetical protein IE53DRAFT_369757 [Violaceomyces palustris]|uniref:Uncharacterized protein n=1 Tax=Violaceomyces palustris TaxID=1673888 RepID=A0ACD0NUH4_9BASI|nr:hypothetical protein IE53DRAFT_369757 [Violaceomyces palustris]
MAPPLGQITNTISEGRLSSPSKPGESSLSSRKRQVPSRPSTPTSPSLQKEICMDARQPWSKMDRDLDSSPSSSSSSISDGHPLVFFGTPSKAEYERRVKYETKLRERRLLRRDSLDLARRRTIIFDNRSDSDDTTPASPEGDNGLVLGRDSPKGRSHAGDGLKAEVEGEDSGVQERIKDRLRKWRESSSTKESEDPSRTLLEGLAPLNVEANLLLEQQNQDGEVEFTPTTTSSSSDSSSSSDIPSTESDIRSSSSRVDAVHAEMATGDESLDQDSERSLVSDQGDKVQGLPEGMGSRPAGEDLEAKGLISANMIAEGEEEYKESQEPQEQQQAGKDKAPSHPLLEASSSSQEAGLDESGELDDPTQISQVKSVAANVQVNGVSSWDFEQSLLLDKLEEDIHKLARASSSFTKGGFQVEVVEEYNSVDENVQDTSVIEEHFSPDALKLPIFDESVLLEEMEKREVVSITEMDLAKPNGPGMLHPRQDFSVIDHPDLDAPQNSEETLPSSEIQVNPPFVASEIESDKTDVGGREAGRSCDDLEKEKKEEDEEDEERHNASDQPLVAKSEEESETASKCTQSHDLIPAQERFLVKMISQEQEDAISHEDLVEKSTELDQHDETTVGVEVQSLPDFPLAVMKETAWTEVEQDAVMPSGAAPLALESDAHVQTSRDPSAAEIQQCALNKNQTAEGSKKERLLEDAPVDPSMPTAVVDEPGEASWKSSPCKGSKKESADSAPPWNLAEKGGVPEGEDRVETDFLTPCRRSARISMSNRRKSILEATNPTSKSQVIESAEYDSPVRKDFDQMEGDVMQKAEEVWEEQEKSELKGDDSIQLGSAQEDSIEEPDQEEESLEESAPEEREQGETIKGGTLPKGEPEWAMLENTAGDVAEIAGNHECSNLSSDEENDQEVNDFESSSEKNAGEATMQIGRCNYQDDSGDSSDSASEDEDEDEAEDGKDEFTERALLARGKDDRTIKLAAPRQSEVNTSESDDEETLAGKVPEPSDEAEERENVMRGNYIRSPLAASATSAPPTLLSPTPSSASFSYEHSPGAGRATIVESEHLLRRATVFDALGDLSSGSCHQSYSKENRRRSARLSMGLKQQHLEKAQILAASPRPVLADIAPSQQLGTPKKRVEDARNDWESPSTKATLSRSRSSSPTKRDREKSAQDSPRKHRSSSKSPIKESKRTVAAPSPTVRSVLNAPTKMMMMMPKSPVKSHHQERPGAALFNGSLRSIRDPIGGETLEANFPLPASKAVVADSTPREPSLPAKEITNVRQEFAKPPSFRASQIDASSPALVSSQFHAGPSPRVQPSPGRPAALMSTQQTATSRLTNPVAVPNSSSVISRSQLPTPVTKSGLPRPATVTSSRLPVPRSTATSIPAPAGVPRALLGSRRQASSKETVPNSSVGPSRTSVSATRSATLSSTSTIRRATAAATASRAPGEASSRIMPRAAPTSHHPINAGSSTASMAVPASVPTGKTVPMMSAVERSAQMQARSLQRNIPDGSDVAQLFAAETQPIYLQNDKTTSSSTALRTSSFSSAGSGASATRSALSAGVPATRVWDSPVKASATLNLNQISSASGGAQASIGKARRVPLASEVAVMNNGFAPASISSTQPPPRLAQSVNPAFTSGGISPLNSSLLTAVSSATTPFSSSLPATRGVRMNSVAARTQQTAALTASSLAMTNSSSSFNSSSTTTTSSSCSIEAPTSPNKAAKGFASLRSSQAAKGILDSGRSRSKAEVPSISPSPLFVSTSIDNAPAVGGAVIAPTSEISDISFVGGKSLRPRSLRSQSVTASEPALQQPPSKRARETRANSTTATATAAVAGSASYLCMQNGDMVPPLPLSASEMQRLTSQHTRRNEVYMAKLDIRIERREGFKPPSPSSKIRKSLGGSGDSVRDKVQASKDRASRARRRNGKAEGGEEEDLEREGFSLSIDEDDSDDEIKGMDEVLRAHVKGAGDDEVYTTPPRLAADPHALMRPHAIHSFRGGGGTKTMSEDGNQRPVVKGVRWQRTLFQGPSEKTGSSGPSEDGGNLFVLKSCMAPRQAYALDRHGNLLNMDQTPLSPRLKKTKVVIKKIIYEDDEESHS